MSTNFSRREEDSCESLGMGSTAVEEEASQAE